MQASGTGLSHWSIWSAPFAENSHGFRQYVVGQVILLMGNYLTPTKSNLHWTFTVLQEQLPPLSLVPTCHDSVPAGISHF